MLCGHATTALTTGHFARAASLKVEDLDGSTVTTVDLQKLYFVYVSSKPEDWKFILEVRTSSDVYFVGPQRLPGVLAQG